MLKINYFSLSNKKKSTALEKYNPIKTRLFAHRRLRFPNMHLKTTLSSLPNRTHKNKLIYYYIYLKNWIDLFLTQQLQVVRR